MKPIGMDVKFPFAETFKAPQGEGQHTGTQMLFARLVGCSVGQTVCTACDTDFSHMYPMSGGGLKTAADLMEQAGPVKHVCFTGGEPLDRDIRPLLFACAMSQRTAHIETSGTRWPDWLDVGPTAARRKGFHALGMTVRAEESEPVLAHGELTWMWVQAWLTVSPKPGYLEPMLERADEIKVIIGGLGDGPGWPTVADAVRWADAGKLVYVQPRNNASTINRHAMNEALDVVAAHPQLKLSAQLHKYVGTR